MTSVEMATATRFRSVDSSDDYLLPVVGKQLAYRKGQIDAFRNQLITVSVDHNLQQGYY